MPLHPEGRARILEQLQQIASGKPCKVVEIGRLTDQQFDALCRLKRELGHPLPGSPELVYDGRHHYKGRVVKDGYQITDLLLQIEAALASSSTIEIEKHMTAVVSASLRNDGYGNMVRDRVILELQQRKPRGEVYSAIPKGDRGGPKKQQGP